MELLVIPTPSNNEIIPYQWNKTYLGKEIKTGPLNDSTNISGSNATPTTEDNSALSNETIRPFPNDELIILK